MNRRNEVPTQVEKVFKSCCDGGPRYVEAGLFIDGGARDGLWSELTRAAISDLFNEPN